MKFNNTLVQILSPFGEWPHRLGMQVVDEKSLEKMKYSARFSTLLGCGIPVYVGHPDESPKSKARPVGKISRMFSTGDGIAVEAKYSDEAFRKISDGKLRAMSPRWRMEKLPDGRFRPIKLVSAGLTNNPNIPESGRIIRSIRKTANLEALKSVGGESSDAAKSLRECADGAKRLAKLSREAVVQTRIVLAKKAQQQKPQHQKIPTAKQIARLAARAASESNLPYVKTFAQLRKKYSVSTKPQTKELNEE